MYKVNDELYINIKYVSSIYRNKDTKGWRLVMLGASEYDEFGITHEEAVLLLKFMEMHKSNEEYNNG